MGASKCVTVIEAQPQALIDILEYSPGSGFVMHEILENKESSF